MIATTNAVRQVYIPHIGQVSFNVHPLFLVVSEQFHTTYCFDYDGRWMSCFCHGKNYKRGLANAVLMKYVLPDSTRQRQLLEREQVRELVEHMREWVANIQQHLPAEGFADIAAWLERVLLWDNERLDAEQALFDAIYLPIGILPPDQYLSVVLQATEGCTWNQCTFCSFYHGRKFRIKNPQQFRTHAEQVRAFFGNALGLHKSIFLGDANALVIPQPRLLELIQIVHDVFPIATPCPDDGVVLDGIYAFLDIFGAEQKTVQDYRELYDAHVKRVYVGLETGDETLFRLLNKPGSPTACREVVQTIKAAGIYVAVILLAGVGGKKLAHQHITHSVDLITQMQLDRGDIVYVSPLIVSGDDMYSQRMDELGIDALTVEQTIEQVEIFKAALKVAGGPRVTLYHIDEFLY